MLKRDKINIAILLLLGSFSACIDSSTKQKPLVDVWSEYKKNKFNKYQSIYNNANDSINKWKNDSLQVVLRLFYHNWILDSTLCFNSDSNRFFSSTLTQIEGFKNATSDDINEFGGAKIDGRWYFFFLSGSLVVPREHYQEDMYSPLSFEKLSEVAHKEIMQGALKKNKEGSYIPNDDFFKQKFYDQWGWGCDKCKTQYDWDTLTMRGIIGKWQYKIDKKELLEIQAEMAKSIRPTEPVKKKSWWEKLFN